LKRVGAYILDIIIISILFALTLVFLHYLGIDFIGLPSKLTLVGGGFIPITFSYLLTLSLFSWIHLVYFVILEYDKILGSTLGKKVASLKVVNMYGQEIGLASSFIRNVFRLLWPVPFIAFEIFLYIDPLAIPNIAYISGVILVIDLVLIVRGDQRIGDRLAGTYIIEE
ncbi:MAG: RDD family protein, partial [Candidatus Thermoplasmatota archaeon]